MAKNETVKMRWGYAYVFYTAAVDPFSERCISICCVFLFKPSKVPYMGFLIKLLKSHFPTSQRDIFLHHSTLMDPSEQ